MGPEQLTIDALAARVASGTIRELIMATNPNLEGDGTALLIANRLGGIGQSASPGWPAAWPPAAPWNSPTATCSPTPCPAVSPSEDRPETAATDSLVPVSDSRRSGPWVSQTVRFPEPGLQVERAVPDTVRSRSDAIASWSIV